MPKDSFLVNRIKSVGFAVKGAFLLVKTEASIKVQTGLLIMVTIAGFYFDISKTEWIAQIFAISLVMGLEGLNTAVEKLADFVQPKFDEKIGFIKDISAGAVMFVSIGASIVGVIIYYPKFFS
ncbi:MAG: diacylglycerol kinase family protein [Cellulophaga sp.]